MIGEARGFDDDALDLAVGDAWGELGDGG